MKRKQSLNVLYMEMRAVGEASVRHRGGGRFVDAAPAPAESGNGQGSKPPLAPKPASGSPEKSDSPAVMNAAIARSNSRSKLSSMAMYDTADSAVLGGRSVSNASSGNHSVSSSIIGGDEDGATAALHADPVGFLWVQ